MKCDRCGVKWLCSACRWQDERAQRPAPVGSQVHGSLCSCDGCGEQVPRLPSRERRHVGEGVTLTPLGKAAAHCHCGLGLPCCPYEPVCCAGDCKGDWVSPGPRTPLHGQADKPFCWCEGLFCRLQSDPTDRANDQAIERARAAFGKVYGEDPHKARRTAFGANYGPSASYQRHQRALFPEQDRERRRLWLAAIMSALDARGPVA